MTPQGWIDSAKQADSQLENLWFIAEGATHLAAALEEIARLRAEAGRVVVPELTRADLDREIGEDLWKYATPGSRITNEAAGMRDRRNLEFSAGYRFATSRAHSAPSIRVLKDGECAVSEAELEILRKIASRWTPPFGVPQTMEAQALFDRLYALRTQVAATESGEKGGA